MDEAHHRILEKYGYGNVERQCNEWNNAYGNENQGTLRAAAAERLDRAMGYLQADGEPLDAAAKEIMSCAKGADDERIRTGRN